MGVAHGRQPAPPTLDTAGHLHNPILISLKDRLFISAVLALGLLVPATAAHARPEPIPEPVDEPEPEESPATGQAAPEIPKIHP